MKQMVTTESMLNYLQSMLDEFTEEKRRAEERGENVLDDRYNRDLFDSMIACKEMVEALIHYPVNLQKDGKVTVGF